MLGPSGWLSITSQTNRVPTVVEDEDDEEAVHEVDSGDGESTDAAGFVAPPERNGKHKAAPDSFLGFPRFGERELGGDACLGPAAAASGSCGGVGSLVERSKSTSMMWPLSCIRSGSSRGR